MLDFGLLLLPSLAFGLLATAHVALAARLAGRKPRWRGAVALVVPPLAPYWGWAEGFRAWSSVWLGSLVLYALGLAAASAG